MSEIPATSERCRGISVRVSRLSTQNFWLRVMTRNCQQLNSVATLLFGVLLSFSFSVWTSNFVSFPPLRCLVTPLTRESKAKVFRPSTIKLEYRSKRFLFIAVMTSDKYMDTRARGVWDTWAREVPGKVVFFTGQTNRTEYYKGMPVIQLDVEDEAYPPQRKSFTMLKYVYENFLHDYEWFVRADDDVYMRTDRLAGYLKKLDSSEDMVIGQPGVGKTDEMGKLGLGKNDNFCLGGPGIMMTSNVLRKMGPHLLHCLNKTASFHEDVEVGRCIRHFGGVMCPWGYQAKELFRQVYEMPLQAYHGSLKTMDTEKAITFHPVKDPAYMRRMHAHFASSRLDRLQLRKRDLEKILRNILPFLGGEMHWTISRRLLSDPRDENHRNARNSCQPWEAFDFSKVWALRDKPPLRYIHDGTEVVLSKVVDFSKHVLVQAGEHALYDSINFNKYHSGYMRVDPKTGTEFLLSVGTKYEARKPSGKLKVTRVRRSVRLRQTFGKFVVGSKETYGGSKTIVHFIVPLVERLDNFKRFFESFEKEFLIPGEAVKLLVVYFPDAASPVEQKRVFQSYAKKYPSVKMTWLDVKGPFKRAVALQMGTDFFGNRSLLYYCDVDLVFRREFADRCRVNAVLGKRAYFPVMFSQFNPNIAYAVKGHPGTHYHYSKEAGFWRWYSFGPVCAYGKDINDSGGLNTTLLGWGLEDVELYENFVKRDDIEIFRAPDPGLVHVYHPHAACDPNSTEMQKANCLAAQADLFSSASSSVDYFSAKGYLSEIL